MEIRKLRSGLNNPLVIFNYVFFATCIFDIGSFGNLTELLLLIVMPCRCSGIILNSMVHKYRGLEGWGNIFLDKVNHVFALAHSVWQRLSVYICLEMRKEAAALLSASQSTGQAKLQNALKRQGFMLPLRLYHINHVLGKCI